MFTLKVENARGEILDLSSNSNYSIVGISGLNPPTAEMFTSSIVTSDGSVLNNTRIESRNLVLNIVLNGNIEASRINLYKYFRVKQKCKIYYKNGARDVYIEGYVESFEDDFFVQSQEVQISVICYQPFFNAASELVVDLSLTLANFEFPFAIEEAGREFSQKINTYECLLVNEGEVDNGLIVELRATGTVINPIIYNEDNGEFFGLNYTLQDGDLITINTNVGEKAVTLTRDGVNSNLINYLQQDSTWMKTVSGDNVFAFACEGDTEDFLHVKFIHTSQYLGV